MGSNVSPRYHSDTFTRVAHAFQESQIRTEGAPGAGRQPRRRADAHLGPRAGTTDSAEVSGADPAGPQEPGHSAESERERGRLPPGPEPGRYLPGSDRAHVRWSSR